MPISNVLIKNEAALEFADFGESEFVGRYPGSLANGILISIADKDSFAVWPFRSSFEYTPKELGEYSVAVVDTTGKISGLGSAYQEFAVSVEILGRPSDPEGDLEISLGGQVSTYNAGADIGVIIDNLVSEFLSSPSNSSKYQLIQKKVSGSTGLIYFRNLTLGDDVPAILGNQYAHVSIRRTKGGGFGDILEKYELVSGQRGARKEDGSSNWIVDLINRQSKWVYINPDADLASGDFLLDGGVDDYDVTQYSGLQEFKNSEKYHINYLFGAILPLEKKMIHEVVESRRDCIGFVAPDMDDVVNNAGNEAQSVADFREVRFNIDSTYVFTTDNWARVYDPYNNTYRWIPTCGGTAGLKARTDTLQNAWTSPAGHTRGVYLGYDRLAWSAEKEERDELYKIGVNSIVDFGDEGMVLYGDKMTTSRPTAFSRINVRSAFIVAEVSVANFAKYYFFENNNEDTRSQFLNAVRPFFRRMIGQDAFERVETQVDEKNNDLSVRQSNRFVGNFRIWPQYSINFIDLYFDAVGSSVSFEETESA